MSKKNCILLGALLLLIGLALLSEGPWLKHARREGPVLFRGKGSAEVTRMEIKGSGEKVVLRKEKGGWLVAVGQKSYPAEAESMKRLLELIDGLNTGTIASRNPANRGLFELEEDKALRFTAFAGPVKAAEILVGLQGPDFFSSYVRLPGKDDVLLVKGYWKPFLDRPLRNWRDLALLSFKPEDVRGIELILGGMRLVIERDSERWKITAPSPGAADADTVTGLLARLSTLHAFDGVDGQSDDQGFAQPTAVVKLKLAGGINPELTVGRLLDPPGQYYVRVTGKEGTYLVSAPALGDLTGLVKKIRQE